MINANTAPTVTSTTVTTTQPEAPAIRPRPRTVQRKIGRTTYTVSSRFTEGKERDIVSTIARLIEYDGDTQDKI